jgi:hypothetical protein
LDASGGEEFLIGSAAAAARRALPRLPDTPAARFTDSQEKRCGSRVLEGRAGHSGQPHFPQQRGANRTMQHQDKSQQTGTRNETYDVISVLYHALQGAENCQIYAKDAQDGQLRDFFEQAMKMQRQLADHGKQMLQQALQKDTGGQSAFGWGQSQQFGQGQSSSSGSQNQQSFAQQGSGRSSSRS